MSFISKPVEALNVKKSNWQHLLGLKYREKKHPTKERTEMESETVEPFLVLYMERWIGKDWT